MDGLLDDLGFLVSERLPRLRQGRPDAKLTLETARLLRQYGCALLLSHLDEEGFRDHLRQSASLYLELLARRQACSDFDQYYLARSKAEPLFDALASGDMALAQRVASSLSTSWLERMEPEEDFHYFGVLGSLLLEQEPSTSLSSFERCLQGGSSSRFEVVSALATRDSEGFEQALLALVEEESSSLERQRRSGLFDPHLHQTEAFIFVEGVALVRLARRLGLETRPGYRLLPEPALG